MLKTLQKHAPTITILLLIALLTALLFYPDSSRLLSNVIIIFGIGTAIAFTVHRNWEIFQQAQGALFKADFLRNTTLDLLGLALTMGAAIWLGRLAGNKAGQLWGMLVGILAAVAVGLVVGFSVQKIWGRIAKPMKAD